MPPWQTMPPVHMTCSKAAYDGRDCTTIINRQLQANGSLDPTNGATLGQILGGDGELTVYGKGPEPLVFAAGAPPPYNMSSLFEAPGSMTMPPPLLPDGSLMPVVALVYVSSISDVPAPPSGGQDGEFVLSLERPPPEDAPSPRASPNMMPSPGPMSAGPFKAMSQGKNLLQATRTNATLVVKPTMEELAKGQMDVRVALFFKARDGKIQRVAATSREEPLMVSWKPAPMHHTPLYNAPSATFGGLQLSHRLADENELRRGPISPSAKAAMRPQGVQGDVNGASGKFKNDPEGAVIEAASLAVEAQNRALLQRVKLAEPGAKPEDTSHHMWELPTGYRDFSDLDAVFSTMGPNYVAESNAVGNNLCRVYIDDTSVWKELTEKGQAPVALGKPRNPQEAERLKGLIGTIYPENPELVKRTLRPVICKDVEDIKNDRLRNANMKPMCRVNIAYADHLGGSGHKVIVEVPNKSGAKWESSASNGASWKGEAGVVPEYAYGDNLKVTLVDQGWIFGDTLGEARLMGSDIYPEAWNGPITLQRKGNKSAGGPEVRLHLAVMVEEPKGASTAWPPDPPMYAQVAYMNPSDQETQRLANWDPHQCAKLPFADVNPNYQMNEDIWGALKDGKSIEESALLEKPPGWKPERVKDSCPIA